MSGRASGYVKGLVRCPNGELITRAEKYAGLILADSHQDRANRRTYPSVVNMAEDGMMSVRQFQRLLTSLETKGVIRREYPQAQGSGRMTYYFFPALDDAKEAEKGCQNVTLFDEEKTPQQGAFFGAKGDRKDDGKGDKNRTLYMSNKSNKSNKNQSPVVPASGDDEGAAINRAMEQVCSALDIPGNQRRRRRMIASAVKRACEKGDTPPAVALAMIEASKLQDLLYLQGQLKYKCGLERFIGGGIWRDEDRWGWDPQAMRMQAQARVGMR